MLLILESENQKEELSDFWQLQKNTASYVNSCQAKINKLTVREFS